jgi:hypothetical protein
MNAESMLEGDKASRFQKRDAGAAVEDTTNSLLDGIESESRRACLLAVVQDGTKSGDRCSLRQPSA